MELLWRCVIVILLSQLIRRTSQYGDENGREFLLAFPVLTGTFQLQDGDIYLYVKGKNDGEVQVSANGITTITRTVTSQAQQITLSSTVFYTNFGTSENKGVHVTATQDVTLYVMRGYEEGYMALPKSFWSTEYCIVSYTPVAEGYSYFAFTAYEIYTSVEITFKTQENWTCIDYVPVSGQTVTITLAQHRVWGLYCKNDLTGTLIKSSNPISVISGAIIPWTDSTGTWLEFIEEMLLPLKSHGRHFALPTIPEVSTIYRITASVDDTYLDAEGWIYTHLDAGQYLDLNSDDVSFICLKSNHPIQIMIIGVNANDSPVSADGILGDTFMITIPPVESFQKTHDIDIFHTTADMNHVLFLVEEIYKDDLVNSLPWTTDSYWVTTGCCNYEAVHLVDHPSDTGVLTITKEYAFGVVQLGTKYGEGFGFMAATAYGAPFCRNTYESLNTSKLCVREYTTSATWQEAANACAQESSRLVKLDSDNKITEAKAYFLNQLDTQSFWIGLTKVGSPDFYWTDGDVITTNDWGSPGSVGKCVHLGKDTTAGWFQENCGATNGYICEQFVAMSGDIDIFPASCIFTHPQCVGNYTYLGETSTCIRVSDTPRSWSEAAADCLSTGDRLLIVSNIIMSVLETFMKYSWPDYHIGIFNHNQTWVGTNCVPLNYTNWGSWHPGAGGAEGCVSSVGGAWQAGPCNVSLPYVCEKNIGTSGTTDPFVLDTSCEELLSSSILPSSSELAGVTSSPSMTISPSITMSTNEMSDSSLFTSSDISSLLATSSSMLETSSSMLETSYFMLKTSSDVSDAQATSILQSSSEDISLIPGSTPIDFSSSIFHDIFSSSLSSDFIGITPGDSVQYSTDPKDMSFSTDQGNMVSTQAVQSTPSSQLDSSLDLTSEPSTFEVCRCGCLASTRLTNLSPSAVSIKDKEIKSELLLNTRNLTKHMMKYTSRKDDRPSASGIGALGVLLIVFTAIVIFGSDIINIMKLKSSKGSGSKNKITEKL